MKLHWKGRGQKVNGMYLLTWEWTKIDPPIDPKIKNVFPFGISTYSIINTSTVGKRWSFLIS
jgi:hypothetical protein